MQISYRTQSDQDGDDGNPADDDLLEQLRTGDRRVVDQLYLRHAEAFVKWGTRTFPHLDAPDLEEAYLEAVMCLYENLMSGRLTRLTASLRTYLFAIGARICKKLEKSRLRTINVSALLAIKGKDDSEMLTGLAADVPELLDDPFGLAALSDEEQRQHERLAEGLRRLSADCRDLLIAFYYHNFSVADATEEFNHRDAAVTRTRKSVCLARLRELVRY